MVRIRRIVSTTITLLLLFSVSALVLAPIACNSNENILNEDKINLPPLDSADKKHPKLDSQLNQLVSAEAHGEAVLFAEQSNIELVNTDVRVIIECVPGQLEAATEAATSAGAKLEASYDDLLQVVVPITRLGTLADASSIHFIRLPQQPLPAPAIGWRQ